MMISKLCMFVELSIFSFCWIWTNHKIVGYFVDFERIKKNVGYLQFNFLDSIFHFSTDYIHSWDAPDWWKPATHKHFFFKTNPYTTSELNFAKNKYFFFDLIKNKLKVSRLFSFLLFCKFHLKWSPVR